MGLSVLWTTEEQRNLFQGYFDGLAVPCPTCGEAVVFKMSHTREVVTLLMRCPECENVALLLFTLVVGLPAQQVSQVGRGF
jgi:hypothetical protein